MKFNLITSLVALFISFPGFATSIQSRNILVKCDIIGANLSLIHGELAASDGTSATVPLNFKWGAGQLLLKIGEGREIVVELARTDSNMNLRDLRLYFEDMIVGANGLHITPDHTSRVQATFFNDKGAVSITCGV
jgi:hypothetical protein